MDDPNVGNPIVDDPNVGNPVVDDPNVGNPVVDDPNVGNPVVDDPNAGNPVVDDPNAGNPVVDDPNAGNPVVDDPNAADPDANDPNAGNPVVDDPNVGNPVVDDPNAGNPVVDDPNVGNPVVDDPNAGNPVVDDPNAGNPVVDDPDAADPDANDPDAADPDAADPDAADPDAADPDAADPDANDPNAGNPVVDDPNAGNPVVDDPNAADPDANDPDANDPDVNDPDANDPDANDPDANDPDAADPDANDPDVNDPDVNDPDANDPDANDPDANDPDAADPDANDPNAADPDANDPDANDPDANDPDANTPSDDNKPAGDKPVMVDLDGDGEAETAVVVVDGVEMVEVDGEYVTLDDYRALLAKQNQDQNQDQDDKPETVMVDLDGDGEAETAAVVINGVEMVEMNGEYVTLDDYRALLAQQDQDPDDELETVMVDLDGDGEAETAVVVIDGVEMVEVDGEYVTLDDYRALLAQQDQNPDDELETLMVDLDGDGEGDIEGVIIDGVVMIDLGEGEYVTVEEFLEMMSQIARYDMGSDLIDISKATVTLSATEFDYDGSVKSVTVTAVLLNGVDIWSDLNACGVSITGDSGKDADTYTLKVEAVAPTDSSNNQKYKGTAEAKWNINKVQIDVDVDDILGIGGLPNIVKTFDGTTNLPTGLTNGWTLTKDGAKINVKAVEYTGPNGTGSYATDQATVVFSLSLDAGEKNYTLKNDKVGVESSKFRIDKMTTTKEMFKVMNAPLVYNGQGQRPIVGFKPDGTNDAIGIFDIITRIVIDDHWGRETKTDAGKYIATVTVNHAQNYTTGTFDVEWTIQQLPLANTMFSISPLVYTGAEQTAVITVLDSRVDLSGCDVTGITGTDIGNYTAKIAAKEGGNYSGEVEIPWSIGKIPLTAGMFVATNFEFDGNDHDAEIAVNPAYAGNVKPNLTDDVTVEKVTKKDAGSYTVTVTAKDTSAYFTGSVELPWSIGQRSLNNCQVDVSADLTYTGVAQEPTVKVTHNGNELVQGKDYTVSYPATDNRIDAGKYSVILTAVNGGNYAGTRTATDSWEIKPRSLTDADVLITVDSTGLTYTGKKLTPAITVMYNGMTLDADDYEATYPGDDQTNAGGHKVTLTGKGNYTGEVIKDWSIDEREVAIDAPTVLGLGLRMVKTYDGTTDSALPTITEHKDDEGNATGLTVTKAAYTSADAGTHSADVELKFTSTNHVLTFDEKKYQAGETITIPVESELVVQINPATVTIDAAKLLANGFDVHKTYDGDPNAAPKSTQDGEGYSLNAIPTGVNGEKLDLTIESVTYAHANVGVDTATVTFYHTDKNYTITVNQTDYFAISAGSQIPSDLPTLTVTDAQKQKVKITPKAVTIDDSVLLDNYFYVYKTYDGTVKTGTGTDAEFGVSPIDTGVPNETVTLIIDELVYSDANVGVDTATVTFHQTNTNYKLRVDGKDYPATPQTNASVTVRDANRVLINPKIVTIDAATLLNPYGFAVEKVYDRTTAATKGTHYAGTLSANVGVVKDGAQEALPLTIESVEYSSPDVVGTDTATVKFYHTDKNYTIRVGETDYVAIPAGSQIPSDLPTLTVTDAQKQKVKITPKAVTIDAATLLNPYGFAVEKQYDGTPYATKDTHYQSALSANVGVELDGAKEALPLTIDFVEYGDADAGTKIATVKFHHRDTNYTIKVGEGSYAAVADENPALDGLATLTVDDEDAVQINPATEPIVFAIPTADSKNGAQGDGGVYHFNANGKFMLSGFKNLGALSEDIVVTLKPRNAETGSERVLNRTLDENGECPMTIAELLGAGVDFQANVIYDFEVKYANDNNHDIGKTTCTFSLVYDTIAQPITTIEWENRDEVLKITMPEAGSITEVIINGAGVIGFPTGNYVMNDVVELPVDLNETALPLKNNPVSITYTDLVGNTRTDVLGNTIYTGLSINAILEPVLLDNNYFDARETNLLILRIYGTEWERVNVTLGNFQRVVKLSGTGQWAGEEQGNADVLIDMSSQPENTELECTIEYVDINGNGYTQTVLFDSHCFRPIITSPVFEEMTVLTGIAEINSSVWVQYQGAAYKGVVRENGYFEVEMPMLFAGDTFEIHSMDIAKNRVSYTVDIPALDRVQAIAYPMGDMVSNDKGEWYIQTEIDLDNFQPITVPVLAGNSFVIGSCTYTMENGELVQTFDFVDDDGDITITNVGTALLDERGRGNTTLAYVPHHDLQGDGSIRDSLAGKSGKVYVVTRIDCEMDIDYAMETYQSDPANYRKFALLQY
ncbi:MAG: hypothetical protein ACI4PG_08140 [Candidatus Ventricola sp.]